MQNIPRQVCSVEFYVDLDECATGNHNCQQQCHNTVGSYTCSCNSGFDLNSDGRTCTGTYTIIICHSYHGPQSFVSSLLRC